MKHDTNEDNALTADLITENDSLSTKLEDNETTIDNLSQEVASLERQLATAKEESAELTHELARAIRQIRKAEQEAARARVAELDARKRAEAEAKRRAHHGNRIQELETAKKSLADELAQVKGELTDALNILDSKTKECLENTDRIESLREIIRGHELNEEATPGSYCDICATRLETITGRDLQEENLARCQHQQDIDGLQETIAQREATIAELRDLCAKNQLAMNQILAAASQHLEAIIKLVQ